MLMTYQDPKVLIAIPTYEGKDYIFNANFHAVNNINYKNYDYVYIDNSKSPNYYYKLKRRGANAVRVPRGDNSRQALCNAQNWARQKVLDEGYDYLLFIESDLTPDKECMNRLLSHNKFVVGSLYFLESTVEEKSLPIYKYLNMKAVAENFGGYVNATIKGNEAIITDSKLRMPCVFFIEKLNIKEFGTRLIKPHEVKDYYLKGLRRVHGMGLGCTLIKKDILQNHIFWYDERDALKHSDVYFYMELNNENFPVFLDTNIVIPHFPSKWSDVKDR